MRVRGPPGATDGKSLACFPGPRRFHTRIQSQKVVWNAISSITLVIWAISREACSIRPIASMALRTTAPDWIALSFASPTMVVASLGPLGRGPHDGGDLIESGRRFFKGCACCSVRFDKSLAALLSSDAPSFMCAGWHLRTLPMVD